MNYIENPQQAKSKLIESKIEFLLLIPILLYIIIWSYISYLRIASLDATYFDLGSFMERLWFIPRYSWSLSSFIEVFSNTGLEFLLFPLSYLKSYILFVVLQSIGIGACALPIYGISKYYLRSKVVSSIIALSFLLYFPIAGSNYFDVHFQTFFPILFISAYYFYLKERYLPALVFFILSGTVRYPYFIFPALFSLLGILEIVYGYLLKEKTYDAKIKTKIFFFVAILSISITMLLIREISSGPFTAIPISTTGQFNYNLENRFLTIALFFGPLLFIPLLSWKWSLFYTPLLFLIFKGPSIYYYPLVFTDQYAILIYSFIFIGFIEGLSFVLYGNKCKGKKISIHRKGKRRAIQFSKKGILVALTVLVLLATMDIAFEPYGPYNNKTQVNFHLAENMINSSTNLALIKAASLIPSNDPYVLTQNNLINIYPRANVPPNKISGLPLIAGVLNIGSGLTTSEIENNSIPLDTGYGVIYIKVDYVLADLNSSWYYFDSYGYPSMQQLVHSLYTSGCYRIVLEHDGILLLERGNQSLLKYDQQNYFYPGSNDISNDNSSSGNNDVWFVFNSTNPVEKISPSFSELYIYLFPDIGNTTFYLDGRNNSADQSVQPYGINMKVYYATPNASLETRNIFLCPSDLTISTSHFLPYELLRGLDLGPNGILKVFCVKSTMLAPPFATLASAEKS